MGLFGKRRDKRNDSHGSGRPRPISVNDADCAEVRRLLTDFEQAVGQDAPVRRAANAIAKAGGYTSMVDLVTTGGDVHRPWRWLSAVARYAADSGDPVLVGRIWLFVSFWSDAVAPLLGPADWMDIGLDRAPDEVQAEVAGYALINLAALDVTTKLVASSTGDVDVRTLLAASADRIRSLKAKGLPIDPSIVDRAGRY